MLAGNRVTIREVLDAALAGFGGSQAELARALHLSESTVSRWYSGKANPDPWSCLALAEIATMQPEDVLRAAGHEPDRLGVVRKSKTPPNPADTVDPELRRRMARMERTLSQYPRAFWAAILDANERMVDAAESLTPPSQPPVKPAENPGVKHPVRSLDGEFSGPDGPLTVSYRRDSVAA